MAIYVNDERTTDKSKAKEENPGARKGEGVMKDAELQGIFDGLVASAKNYTDTVLSPARAEAGKLYDGDKFGNEEEGRSQFVSTDVRDAVRADLPPVLRALVGPDRVVEFLARTAKDVPMAEQVTEFLNHEFMEANSGFMRTLDVLQDGLIRKIGVFKWMWDDRSTTKTYRNHGVTQEQLESLMQDDGVEVHEINDEDPIAGQPPTFEVELTMTEKDGCIKIFAVPPEEIIYDREARSIEDATFFAHVTEKTHGDLIAMGVSKKDVEEHGGASNMSQTNDESVQRQPDAFGAPEEAGKANTKTRYIEAYVKLDVNGDGVAELRKICAIGDGNFIVENEPADHRPFSAFCPAPKAHTLTGQSYADLVGSIQRAKSSVIRGMFDSLSASIFPRTWYREGYANLADVLNTAIGAPIRVKTGANDVGEFGHTFMGKEAMPVLDYLNGVIERSVGSSKGAQGLDIDALQSTEKDAAKAAVSATQLQQEMLVRLFAEQAYKPMFRGMLRLYAQYQPRARTVKLRDQYVEIDPASWDVEMDVTVNVTLGAGLTDEKVITLQEIAMKMETIIEKMGPMNPLCDIKMYRDTLAEITVLRGRKDAARYWKPVDLQALQQQQEAAAQQPPPPSPEMMLAQAQIQIEQMKAQADMQIAQMKAQAQMSADQAKLQQQMIADEQHAQAESERQRRDFELREKEILLRDDRERDKQAAEIVLKRIELNLTHQATLTEQEINAEIERERISSQAEPTTEA